MLGCDLGTPEGQNKFEKEQLQERCARYTSKAAEIAARLILENQGFPITPVTQLEEIRRLLADSGLPVADIAPDAALHFFGYRIDSELVGIVGLALCGSASQLRSLAAHASKLLPWKVAGRLRRSPSKNIGY